MAVTKEYRIMNTCEECEGSGLLWLEPCETCDRDGYVSDPSDGGTMMCPECDGGAAEICPHCEDGVVYDDTYLDH